MKPGLCFLLLLLVVSCTPDPFQKETKKFSAYLKEVQHKEIGEPVHYYFIVTNNSCYPCIKRFTGLILKNLKPHHKEYISLISSVPDIIDPALVNCCEILTDPGGQINFVDLDLYNFTVFVTHYGKINGRRQFQSNQDAQFISFICGI